MRAFTLEPIGASRGAILARIEGIDDREAAQALAGTRLYVSRAALPEPDEEEYYHADLLGLRALSTEGEEVGSVSSVLPIGETDVLPEVDLDAGRVVIEMPVETDGEDRKGDA